MNRLWGSTIGVIFLASTILCLFSMLGLENDDPIANTGTQNASSVVKTDKRMVDPEEYERFLESLYATDSIRHRFFEQLKLNETSSKGTSSNQSIESSLPKPSIFSVTYRNFNFHTGEQQEDQFDCDLLLLTQEEASLLEKVKKIESIGDSMQDEVLEICRSIDKEFHVICRYAEKCEREMGHDAYTVLKYVISSNNESIMSCHAKESEWIGFGLNQIDGDSGIEWIDEHGLLHYHHYRQYKSEPCISQAQVYQCFTEHFGAMHFDLARQSISTQDECNALHKFDRCIKRFIFEEAGHNCTLEEKETSLEILRGMFVFDLSQGGEKENEAAAQIAKCRSTRDLWSQSNYASVQKVLRENDNAFRYTETLRSGYQLLKNDDCYARTVVDDELCLQRFENKVRKLWNGQGIDNHITLEDEITIMCCITAELSTCMSTFVLIRCGLEQFSPYQNRVEFLRLASMPDECSLLPYFSSKCQSIF